MPQLAYIPLLPLIGAALAYILGSKRPALSGWIATAASTGAFILTLSCFASLGEKDYFAHTLFNWFSVGGLKVDFAFHFDHLSAVMCLVVTGIGSLIHLYSVGYMAEDGSRPRFFAYLNLFMFSMLLLVLGGNLLILFIGWEGVGLCSYLLIGFWHQNFSYAQAGRKAFVVNRIGDFGFLIGIFLLLQHFGTVDFIALEEALASYGGAIAILSLIGLCLFVGACGKSAQIPLFVWLPDAMAGPTPVSALIHAATMVTAGVYMMARLHFIFDLAPFTLAIVCFVAVLTAFIAATTALTQNDIKKVLAYSTVSQLGFMFIGVASGIYWVAVFHLVTHAFFKACLFLGAGSVIHGCHHEQDMRHMGGLASKMPLTCATYAIATIAIAGIAPFAGYYSKHGIISALEHTSNMYLLGWAEGLVLIVNFTAFLTAFYMTRSFALTFLGSYRGHAHPHESPPTMTVPLIVLALLSLAGGIYLSHGLEEYLSSVLPVASKHHAESFMEALAHSWIGILGVALALLFYTRLQEVPGRIYRSVLPLSKLFTAKYYFDEIYQAIIVRPLEGFAGVLFRTVDQGMIDEAVNGAAAFVDTNGEIVRTIQTGQVRHYALFMFLAAVFFIAIYLVL